MMKYIIPNTVVVHLLYTASEITRHKRLYRDLSAIPQ